MNDRLRRIGLAAMACGFLTAAGTAAPRVVETIPLPVVPYPMLGIYSLAVDSASGRVYAGGYTSWWSTSTTAKSLVALNGNSLQPEAGATPVSWVGRLLVHPGLSRLYVLNYNALTTVDAATLGTVATAPLPGYVMDMDLDVARNRIAVLVLVSSYTSTTYSYTYEARLVTVDAVSGQVVTSTVVARPSGWPFGVARVDPGTGRIYAAVSWGIYDPLTYAYTMQGRLASYGADGVSAVASQPITVGAYDMAVDGGLGRVFLGSWSGVTAYDAGSLASLSANSVPAARMAVDRTRHRLYTSSWSNQVKVVDAATLSVTTTVSVSGGGIWAIACADGGDRVYAADGFAAKVYAWDATTFAQVGEVSLKPPAPRAVTAGGGQVYATEALGAGFYELTPAQGNAVRHLGKSQVMQGGEIAVFPSLNRALIVDEWDLRVRTFELGAGQSAGDITVPGWPRGVGVERDRNRAYFSYRNWVYDPLLVVDAASNATVQSIGLGPEGYPQGVGVNPVTRKAFVADYNLGVLKVVDLQTSSHVATVSIGYYPSAVAVSVKTNRVFVAHPWSSRLTVVDGATYAVLGTVSVGYGPSAVAVHEATNRVFVANRYSNSVTVVNAVTLMTLATLAVGAGPSGVAVDDATNRVYVANQDGGTLSVIQDDITDTVPPVISHSPIPDGQSAMQDLVVGADITDNVGVLAAWLSYRYAGDAAYTRSAMALVGGTRWEGRIPTRFLLAAAGRRVEYCLDATDAEGNGPAAGLTPGTPSQPNTFSVAFQTNLKTAWSYQFGHVFGSYYRMIPGPSAAIADLRPDLPGLEVATGNEEYYPILNNWTVLGRWFLFGPNGGVIWWKNTENDEAHSSVNVFDLNADGRPDMVGGTTSGNQVQAWDSAATWLWRYSMMWGAHVLSTPAIGDVHPSPGHEVVAGAFDGYLRCLNGQTGAELWKVYLASNSWYGAVWSSPMLADLDGDGSVEVVVGCDNGRVYCVDAKSGAVRWSCPVGYSQVRGSAGLLEVGGQRYVVIGGGSSWSSGALYVISSSGTVVRTFTPPDAGGGGIISSPAIGDVDFDGTPDILFGAGNGYVYCLDGGTGALKWKRATGGAVYSSPALARRTGEPRLDVYVGSMDGILYLLNGRTGEILDLFAAKHEIASSPVVGDVDGDGKLEVFFQDRFGDINNLTGDYFWAVRDQGSSVPPYTVEWPMFRANRAHTGLYQTQDTTPPAPPSGLTVSDVPGDEGTALAVTWTANSESDFKEYRVYRATAGDLKVAPTRTWLVTTNSMADTGLMRRSTYYYQVAARDTSGNESSPSAAVSGVPVDNLPPPAPTAPVVTAPPEGRTLRLSWSAAAAPDLAGYRLWRATYFPVGIGGAFSPAATIASSGTTHQDSGLTDGVTSYYRVTAHDDSGNESVGSPEVKGVPQDTVPPVTPSGFCASDVPGDPGGVVNLIWGANAEPDLAGYALARSKSQSGAGEFQVGLPAGTTVYLDIGLTDYVNYFYTLAAEDRAGNRSASVMVSTMPKPSEQFIVPPAPQNVAAVAPPAGRSAQVGWSLPPGVVRVIVCVSTQVEVTGPIIYQGTETVIIRTGLTNGTTYVYTIRAVDAWGRLSAPVTAVVIPKDTVPPPAPPALWAGGGALGTVVWEFPAEPEVQAHVVVSTQEAGPAYLVYEGTGTGLSFPAQAGATYYVSVKVCDFYANCSAPKKASLTGPPAAPVGADLQVGPPSGGASGPAVPVPPDDVAVVGAASSPPAALAPPAGTARATIRVPEDGKRIRGNAVTVIAESADQPRGVLFQFRAEKAQDWRDITSRDNKPPFAVYWNVSALANGPYRLRAVAYDSANRPDPAPGEVAVTVDDVNPDIVEDGNPAVDPNKPHRKEEKVSETKDTVVVVADGTKAEVPKGAVKGSASLTVTAVPAAQVAHLAPPKESTLKSAGVYREFSVSGRTTFNTPVTITLPYPDEDHDGIVDGTSIKNTDLRVHFRNETTGEWEEVRGAKQVKISHAPGEPSGLPAGAGALGAALYPQGNAVVASVDHFTLFGLFARAAKTDLLEVIVYPNPCVPSQGQAGFTFDGLPAGAVRIRIYTLSGRLVRDAAVESAGTWLWNLTTDDGEAAVTGAYLYVVSAPNLGAAKGKIALVR